MNAEFKEEQIGTPFAWVGALEGGDRGGGGAKGGSIQKILVTYNTFFFHPPVHGQKNVAVQSCARHFIAEVTSKLQRFTCAFCLRVRCL